MRSTKAILIALITLLTLPPELSADASSAGWQRIPVPTEVTDPRGAKLHPSCSGGPVLQVSESGASITPADTAFSFFMRAGDPDRLAIFFDGGGACWDSTTCVVSALAGSAVYDLTVDETPERLAGLGGIADRDDSRNPLRGFTQVFIPYCTGDLHFGNTDTTYALPGGGQWPIHHRGHENVMAVLTALRSYYGTGARSPKQIVLAGVSAGGYGVLYNLPAVADTFPGAKELRAVVDSSNGVMTDALYSAAIAPDGAWGVWEDLDPGLQSAFSSGADNLIVETFRDLGRQYPKARLGQYTRVLDSTQILFYNMARHPGEPQYWVDPTEIFVAGLEWSFKARTAMWRTALTTWGYRFYLAAGTGHTILGDAAFYDERSAGNVRFQQWLSDMIEKRSAVWTQWRNLSCAPACLTQSGLY
jgi:hypothetical protein